MAYTFMDFAEEVLGYSDRPLTYQEIWELGVENKLNNKLNSSGTTPWASLGSRLFVQLRDEPDKYNIVKIGKNPARFFLKDKASGLPTDIIDKITEEEKKPKAEKEKYHERDLHSLVAYFAYANQSFNRGKSIFTKTILHEMSKKKGYSSWVYPDMVGFYVPLEDWSDNLFDFNKISENNLLKIYSFELKKSLNKSNYRESFFQAVSNSTWANEGYLVAADIMQDDDLLAELGRLSNAFGIGIIQLDLKDFDASKALFPAKFKSNLDWEMMNKLCEENEDFDKFVKNVKIDLESKTIHKYEYDDIIEEPNEYILSKLKIK